MVEKECEYDSIQVQVGELFDQVYHSIAQII